MYMTKWRCKNILVAGKHAESAAFLHPRQVLFSLTHVGVDLVHALLDAVELLCFTPAYDNVIPSYETYPPREALFSNFFFHTLSLSKFYLIVSSSIWPHLYMYTRECRCVSEARNIIILKNYRTVRRIFRESLRWDFVLRGTSDVVCCVYVCKGRPDGIRKVIYSEGAKKKREEEISKESRSPFGYTTFFTIILKTV